MATKTINLTGAEVAVTGLDGAHAHIRNDGTEVIYAAKTAGITAGADGVASIPAGQSDTIRGISGAVYLLGTGSVLIQSDDYVASPFKTSAASGGSAVDEVARAAVNTHAGNAEIHVTAEEKAAWNAVKYSNPNLLINPDFAINQRGSTSYSSAGYTVDDWILYISGSGNSGSYDAKTHVLSGSVLDTDGYYVNLFQIIDDPERFAGKVMTLSASMSELNKPALIQVWRTEGTTITGVAATSYNLEPDKVLTFTMPSDLMETSKIRMVLQTRGSVKPNWAKLELGSIATPFTPPDPATELAKCQRYYQIHSTGDIAAVDLRPTMATITDIKQRSDGNYEYIAKL